MAVCISVDEENILRLSNNSIDECNSYVLLTSVEFQSTTDVFTPTPEAISIAFSWGFGAVVIVGYFSAYAVGIAKKLINLA